jgi:hypothetical protein
MAIDNKAEKLYNSIPHTPTHLTFSFSSLSLSLCTKQSDDSPYIRTKKFTLKKKTKLETKKSVLLIYLFIFVGYICLQALLHFKIHYKFV